KRGQRMKLTMDKMDGMLIACPQGVVNSANAEQFEAELMAQVDKGERRVVLDLGRLDYISSAGLRVVLLVAKQLRQVQGELVLCELKPHVREVFEISGFLTIFPVAASREAAAAAFKTASPR